MDFSIIICTYNRSQTLENVLDNIRRLHGSPEITWETLVIDNNSNDGTKAVVTRFIDSGRGNVRYIFEGRQGKSYALNTGIKAAMGEILAFTDDDVIIDSNWLLNIKKTFAHYNCAGIGGKIIPVLLGKKPPWLTTDTHYPFMGTLGSFDWGDECCELNEPPYGANMAFRKETFIKHGLFRIDLGPTEKNSMGKGEDTELSQRLLDRGERVMYVPEAVIYHRVEQERLKKQSFQKWYFNHGRCKTKTDREMVPANSTYYFGVPRNMFRQLFRKSRDWFFSFKPQHRIRYKLECCVILGSIAEYINTRKLPRQSSYK